MKVNILVEEDELLRTEIKNMIKGQVTAILRDELRAMVQGSFTANMTLAEPNIKTLIESEIKAHVKDILFSPKSQMSTNFIQAEAKKLIKEYILLAVANGRLYEFGLQTKKY